MVGQVIELAGVRRDHTSRLKAAGWRPEERCGKIIWAHPETGGWYSQEMALRIAVQREGKGDE